MTAQDPFVKRAIEINFAACPHPDCEAPLLYDHDKKLIYCDGCGRFEYECPSHIEIKTYSMEPDADQCPRDADMVMWAKVS